MLFTQKEFALFFLTVYLVSVLVKSHRIRKAILLLASYAFYFFWDWRFLGLIILSSFVDFYVGSSIARTNRETTAKLLLWLSISTNLSILGFFKYFNFFLDSFNVLLGRFGLAVQNLEIILPVGISFYTFQSLSYTIDVYRRELRACKDLPDFLLFVAFFPQLVAGPIVRAANFLPQLSKENQISFDRFLFGLRDFSVGLFLKLFLAENLSSITQNSEPYGYRAEAERINEHSVNKIGEIICEE